MMKSGWLNIYKPKGFSSATITNLIKKKIKMKVGHAGTLDPLAYGVLPVAIGEATKTISYTTNAIKCYEFEIVFGKTTSTLDSEGDIIDSCDVLPNIEQLAIVMKELQGEINQVPPIFSSIKVNGKASYKYARKGKDLNLPARKILINSLDLLSIDDYNRKARFRVVCGKGTYVRALARDIANKCNSMGFVSDLKRVYVGKFHENNALVVNPENFDHDFAVLPVDFVLDDILAYNLDNQQSKQLKLGMFIPCSIEEAKQVKVYDENQIIALAKVEKSLLKPVRVFNF